MAILFPHSDTLGNELYRIVEAYAELGVHRTGTAVDRATAHWLAAQLQRRDACIERQGFAFDFFDAHARVTLNGAAIPSMPLYYEAVGELKTDKVAVAEFADGEHGSGLDATLERLIDRAVSQGAEALVIATRGPSGDLVAINSEPVLRHRIPVLLVPGNQAGALVARRLRVDYRARLEPGVSTNVIARWNVSCAGPPLVITTPVSGWFNCAGERGTGVAIALYLVDRMLQDLPETPLTLVAPSGHELGFRGGWHAAESIAEPPRAVLHLGSCLATLDGQLQGIVHASRERREAVNEALRPIAVSAVRPDRHRDPACWVGESQCWAKFGMPMLSLAGISPLFHTPGDLPRASTTPALLAAAAYSIGRAAVALFKGRAAVE